MHDTTRSLCVLGTFLDPFIKLEHVPCSKNDALRLLRKLVIAKVLTEETYRQDNQYGGVLSYLAVNERAAGALTQGTLTIKMPFAVSDRLWKHKKTQEENSNTEKEGQCTSSWHLRRV